MYVSAPRLLTALCFGFRKKLLSIRESCSGAERGGRIEVLEGNSAGRVRRERDACQD